MPRGAAASVAPVDRACRRWRPAAAALGGRLGGEVDGDVDGSGVVLAGCGAAGARVGAAPADDGDVVGIALGGDLAVGQDVRRVGRWRCRGTGRVLAAWLRRRRRRGTW